MLYMQHIFKLHGLPKSIVSDRDVVFTSQFWKQLFSVMGTSLDFSTSFHSQTDGQTENVNKGLETYLRCFIFDHPKRWSEWLCMAEWSYNTSLHSSIMMSPYKAVYRKDPPTLHIYLKTDVSNSDVIDWVHERQEVLHQLKGHLIHARDRMKKYANLKRRKREFSVGNMFLKLQPYRQQSVVFRRNIKLSKRFYGPYRVLQRIGEMAYKLELYPPPVKYTRCFTFHN